MFSLRNRELPSPSRIWTPPVWKLNGSSFGPQLLVVQGQVVGPPFGCALLLISLGREPAATVGSPDQPLPVSGSAQRFGQARPAQVSAGIAPGSGRYLPTRFDGLPA